ncbi:MAG: hypothetical protein WKG07_17460 [Hymenobacter sp.]
MKKTTAISSLLLLGGLGSLRYLRCAAGFPEPDLSPARRGKPPLPLAAAGYPTPLPEEAPPPAAD